MSAAADGPPTAAHALRQQLDDGWTFMAGCYDDPGAQMDVLRRMVAQVDGPVLGTRIPPGYTLDDMRDAGFAMLIGGLSLHAAATAILGGAERGDPRRTGGRLPRSQAPRTTRPRR